ncbi:MAG: hypothetical protein IPJ03_03070 [Ignavibacteriales bacterium]|nr:hypothetical protein [Ignavibacteriales bacterium]
MKLQGGTSKVGNRALKLHDGTSKVGNRTLNVHGHISKVGKPKWREKVEFDIHRS